MARAASYISEKEGRKEGGKEGMARCRRYSLAVVAQFTIDQPQSTR